MARKHLLLLFIPFVLIVSPVFAADADQAQASGEAAQSDVEIASPRFGSELDAATAEERPAPAPGSNAGAAADQRPGAAESAATEQRPEPGPEEEPETDGPTGVLDRRDIVAYYGHPFSTGMGILGEYSIQENAERLQQLSSEYDELNGRRGVVPGFHIIYATASAEANVHILQRAKLMEYIRFAEKNDFVIILDHQIGDNDVVSSVENMFEFLKYDSVHLAFDPEWATDRPNEVIGSVTAEEVNTVQASMQEYMMENGIEGKKMLLVHQFNWRMIENRERVRSDFERIDLVHNADGFGPPEDKYASWEYNARATNSPLKGFKLFYPKEWRDGGYDDPLMTPEQVVELEPKPVVIMYQ